MTTAEPPPLGRRPEPFGRENRGEIFVATSDPHGLIEATVRRETLALMSAGIEGVRVVGATSRASTGSSRPTRSRSSPTSSAGSSRGARRCSSAARERAGAISTPASGPTSCAETADVRAGDWRVAAGAGRPGRPPGRDHRPRRAEDDDQRAQLAAPRSSWPTSRTRSRPTWANVVGGQAALARRRPPHARRSTAAEGKAYRLNEQTATLLVRPRGWHLVERHVLVDGEPISASPVRLRAVPLPQRRRGAAPRGSGPVLLPAEAREPPRGAALERRLRRAQDALGIPRGIDPRDGPDRDDPRRVRDGRDPVRAARARRGPERRPLGLHLQPHQEVPRRPEPWCCPTAPR